MTIGIDAAAKGMNGIMTLNDVLANNLANINTTGFKKSNVAFKNFQDILVNQIGTSGNKQAQYGKVSAGSVVDSATIDFQQGVIKNTGNPLDLAINGDGFFEVKTPAGTAYTRNGSFIIGDKGQITTIDNYPLMGEKGPITLDLKNKQVKDIQIDAQGRIQLDGNEVAKIKIVDFKNKNSLQQEGASLFVPSNGQNPVPVNTAKSSVVQGSLEDSNANSIETMVNSLKGMRIYDSLAKTIETSNKTLMRDIDSVGIIKR